MRSTNESRLSACTLATTGREEAPTLITLNRRVAQQVYAGRTKADRRSKKVMARLVAQTAAMQERWGGLSFASDLTLAAMRAQTKAQTESTCTISPGPQA